MVFLGLQVQITNKVRYPLVLLTVLIKKRLFVNIKKKTIEKSKAGLRNYYFP